MVWNRNCPSCLAWDEAKCQYFSITVWNHSCCSSLYRDSGTHEEIKSREKGNVIRGSAAAAAERERKTRVGNNHPTAAARKAGDTFQLPFLLQSRLFLHSFFTISSASSPILTLSEGTWRHGGTSVNRCCHVVPH